MSARVAQVLWGVNLIFAVRGVINHTLLFVAVLLVLVVGGGELDLDAEAGLAAFDVDGFAAAAYAGLGGDEAVATGGDAAHDEVACVVGDG